MADFWEQQSLGDYNELAAARTKLEAVAALPEKWRERATHTADKSGWPWADAADELGCILSGSVG